MGAEQHLDWRAAAASALDWWREAGVDVLVDDAPRDWLAPAPAAAPRAAPASAAPAAMPRDWAAFLAWRAGPGAPEAAWPGPRLPPEGDPAAPLTVVVPFPERDDLAAGALLSGAAGRLFERMLAAIGLTRAGVHLVPVCATRPPGGRFTGELEARLGAMTRHHLMLARPARVLLLGNAATRCVLGMNCAEARGSLRAVNHEAGQGTTDNVVASFHPRQLLDDPRRKPDAWRDLRLLMGEQA